MSLTPSEQAVEDRLDGYNGSEWDPDTNPLGFDGGGNQRGVFVAMLKDVAAYGRIVVRSTTETLAYVSGKVAEYQAAIDAIQAGPVSSVNGRSGAVMGLAELAGAVFTGAVQGLTRAFGDSTKAFATTEFVQAAFPKASAALRRGFTSATAVNTPASDAAAMAFALFSGSGAVAPVFGNGFNIAFTLTGNVTLGQPTGMFDGLPVVIQLIQDATGGRTIAFNAAYHKFPGGVVPTLSTTANAVDRLSGMCRIRNGTTVIEWSGMDRDIK